jgi:hypothetical protein
MDTRCNQMMTVVCAIFYYGGWLHSKRFGDA